MLDAAYGINTLAINSQAALLGIRLASWRKQGYTMSGVTVPALVPSAESLKEIETCCGAVLIERLPSFFISRSIDALA